MTGSYFSIYAALDYCRIEPTHDTFIAFRTQAVHTYANLNYDRVVTHELTPKSTHLIDAVKAMSLRFEQESHMKENRQR